MKYARNTIFGRLDTYIGVGYEPPRGQSVYISEVGKWLLTMQVVECVSVSLQLRHIMNFYDKSSTCKSVIKLRESEVSERKKNRIIPPCSPPSLSPSVRLISYLAFGHINEHLMG